MSKNVVSLVAKDDTDKKKALDAALTKVSELTAPATGAEDEDAKGHDRWVGGQRGRRARELVEPYVDWH